MNRRTLLAGAAALAAAPAGLSSRAFAQAGDEKTRIVFWHAMSGANGDEINRIARDFNASQNEVELEALYKGSYPDTLTAAIAAWRAGQAPHIVQVFEVGTGTMLAAGPAVKQVWQLSEETGAKIDPAAYIPSVRGYYSLADGRMASMPFNSSTGVMWYNKDAFEIAGLDPEKPPATWADFMTAARTLRDKWAKPTMAKTAGGPELFAATTAWFTWIQLEEFSAIHNLAYATKEDGFAGLDTELKFNNPAVEAHLQRFLDLAKDGSFKYGGRDSAPDPLFYSGQAAIGFGSSSGRADIVRNAKFKWAPAVLPYDPEVIKTPNNTIIGGASLWTMTSPKRSTAEYRAVAKFLQFIGQPAQDAMYHEHTGYVSVTLAGYELAKKDGYYEKNPGADVAIKSLTRGTVTENSKGLRLGRLPEIRNIIYEEVEKALQGQQGAKQALDNSVTRGNVVLRQFEKSAHA
jgi:sn-glycerol 3-phosphate transport system substrate-binding protein